MLVLSRRLNEKIVLPSLGVTIQVVAIARGTVRLGIEAPPEISVLREELHKRHAEWAPPTPPKPKEVANTRLQEFTRMLANRLKVTGIGLRLLRNQLAQQDYREMTVTIEKLDEDLDLLRRRLDAEGQPASRRRALLVEDNANERELLASFLRSRGMDVDTARDGNDALDYLQQRGKPDVVLLDMGLPRCDGATIVRTLRCDPSYSDLKIFAVSGHSPDEYDLGKAGVDGWFHKPIDPAQLVADLNRELADTRR
jgi:carbon storage regulator CsrA